MANIKNYTKSQIDFSKIKTKEQKDLVLELQEIMQEYSAQWRNGIVPIKVLKRINTIKKILPLKK